MPRSNSSRRLDGGRALYRGRDAYASQGFENDTRQTELGGLAVIQLYGDYSLSMSVDNEIPFPDYVSKLYSAVYLRGFARLSDSSSRFVVRRGGTYRVYVSVFNPFQGTGQSLNASILIKRGVDEIRMFSRILNSDALMPGPFPASTMDILDLQKGDIFYLLVNPQASAGALLRGNSTQATAEGGIAERLEGTRLILEQVDVTA